jgi:hypothetical protein
MRVLGSFRRSAVEALGGLASRVKFGMIAGLLLGLGFAGAVALPANADVPTTSLSVTARVDTSATNGTFGPFQYAVTCISSGSPVLLATDDAGFTLAAGASHVIDTLPVGANCTVVQSGGDPDSVSTVTNGGSGVTGATASVDLLAQAENDVSFSNTYDTGSLKVTRMAAGPGAAQYGGGYLSAQVSCTLTEGGESVPVVLPNGGTVQLVYANGYTATLSGIAAGAHCLTSTNLTLGAVSNTIDPAGGVTIVTDTTVDSTITDTFLVGSLTVNALRTGNAVAQAGAGPFTVTVFCSYTADTTHYAIDIGSGNMEFQLSSANNYTHTIPNIILGGSCRINQTDSAGATSSIVNPANGYAYVWSATNPAVFAITNDFEQSVPASGVSNTTDASKTTSTLADTGTDAMPAAAGGLALLVLGSVLLLWRSRRPRRTRLSQRVS